MTVSWFRGSGHPMRAGGNGGKQGCRRLNATECNLCLTPVTFSERRDMAMAKAFFLSAKMVTGVMPDRVTTDGHDSYPRAIRTTLGKAVRHRTSRSLNNRLEQDHRGIKGCYWPMLGFTQKPLFKATRGPKNPNQISVFEMPLVTLNATSRVNVRTSRTVLSRLRQTTRFPPFSSLSTWSSGIPQAQLPSPHGNHIKLVGSR